MLCRAVHSKNELDSITLNFSNPPVAATVLDLGAKLGVYDAGE